MCIVSGEYVYNGLGLVVQGQCFVDFYVVELIFGVLVDYDFVQFGGEFVVFNDFDFVMYGLCLWVDVVELCVDVGVIGFGYQIDYL